MVSIRLLGARGDQILGPLPQQFSHVLTVLLFGNSNRAVVKVLAPLVLDSGLEGAKQRRGAAPCQGPQDLPNAPLTLPPAVPGRTQDVEFHCWGPVMTYATFHAPETSFGPYFNTFLAWVWSSSLIQNV